MLLEGIPISSVLVALVCTLLIYFVALSIYRVTLHPLAKYPGPLRYKLSSWLLLWQAYKGNRHIWHLKDHEKYGPIVRIAPNALSFNTDTALSTIYGPRNANVKKGEWYKTFDIAAGTYSSFTETDKDKHAAKRRWLSVAFSAECQRLNEPVIIDLLDRFCHHIEPSSDGWGASWNGSEIATYLGFDIMGSLVFGTDFQTVQNVKNRDLANSVLPASMFLYWISYLPLAMLVRPLLRTKLFEIVGGKPVVDNNRLIDFGHEQVLARDVEEKAGDLSGRKDFLSRIIKNHDKKTGWQPTQADLDTESLNMMNAGADPYSSVLAGIFFYLVHNPEVLQKATSEVRSTFASPDEIVNGTKLNSCSYMYACIEETLRRTAGVPSHLPREILPGGLNVDGHHLPAGTVVGVPAYAIHHTPRYYPDPWSFRPERWIESESVTRENIELARKAFTPFSIGTRQCSGRNLAYLQLKLTVAHILFRFDLRIDPDESSRGGGHLGMEEGREREDEFQMWDALGFGRDGPMIQFRKAAAT
ncbi:benzoate 4-monooxygenase cytochrome P450 [Lophiotrema nucula]|uniref:Benzoate 4-monooxygenase cytochrome P450 n=1 Tax=Lophiotrema nucula TaxID=690887 RepID=A0A6A5ZMU4_9PLEO|nr:benzoate 4-monooxygenase cytochrome P450 [Lophiotrema nucula]